MAKGKGAAGNKSGGKGSCPAIPITVESPVAVAVTLCPKAVAKEKGIKLTFERSV